MESYLKQEFCQYVEAHCDPFLIDRIIVILLPSYTTQVYNGGDCVRPLSGIFPPFLPGPSIVIAENFAAHPSSCLNQFSARSSSLVILYSAPSEDDMVGK